ncbi:MAG: ABC-F family ATP-binding cassette domain-containing protein [Chlorobi bacterium]|nr:ABC-F family ATP-binding cassette domain-containing protein [Chlorobiota bacterium]
MITLQDISIRFGGEVLFNGIAFQIRSHDRIGLTGRNGSGKTTLLKVMASEFSPDNGTVTIPGDVTIGYLPQRITVSDTTTVYEEAASALKELNLLEREIQQLTEEITTRTDFHDPSYLKLTEKLASAGEHFHLLGGETREREISRTLQGLGFRPEDMNRPTGEFSGGWRMRIELAKILLRKPSVLLLDEPTNHLDIDSIQWLEGYFRTYNGALVLVSHDKALLDHVTTRTLEIENQKITEYPAPYSLAMNMKEARTEQLVAAWKNQQKLIASTEAFIERFRYKATKAVQVQSRIKQLEKLERIPEPSYVTGKVHLKFGKVVRTGDLVIIAEKISKSYGNLNVLNNIDLVIKRGEKIAFVGRNGEGKTTLARILAGDLKSEGDVRQGTKVSMGYYAQDGADKLNPSLTVLETIAQVAGPEMRPHLRTMLGAFLFSGDDADKKVSVLSGGERSRLALLSMLMRPVNFLILDEPTHHLDMQTKDILKEALKKFEGTLLVVSHDRDFLDGLVDVIYEVKNLRIKAHDGDIYRFLEENVLQTTDTGKLQRKVTVSSKGDRLSVESRKKAYLQRKQEQRKLERTEKAVYRLEEEIAELENRKENLYKRMITVPDNGDSPDQDLFREYEKIIRTLDEKLADWEAILHNLEKIKTKKQHHE